MNYLSLIRTTNTRLFRGQIGYAEKKLIARANQLGFLTKSGRISKSKKTISSKQLQKALEEYQEEHFEEKQDQTNFQKKKDIEDLISERVPPSEYWQTMRKCRDRESFALSISNKIKDFKTFEEEYQQEILDYLKEEFYH